MAGWRGCGRWPPPAARPACRWAKACGWRPSGCRRSEAVHTGAACHPRCGCRRRSRLRGRARRRCADWYAAAWAQTARCGQPLAALLGVDEGMSLAAAALEVEGTAMRGRSIRRWPASSGAKRHLLARIHRNTLGRLRREIEPVSPADAIRFLCDWQHASARSRLRGPDALASVLAAVEAGKRRRRLEARLLPTPRRLRDRLAGCAMQRRGASPGRLRARRSQTPTKGGRGPGAPDPLVLLPRRELARWTRLAGGGRDDAAVLARAEGARYHPRAWRAILR